MAALCVQEKIIKINAELARLELEMELDHDENGHLGAGYMKKLFGIGGTTKTTTSEQLSTKSTEFSTIVFSKCTSDQSVLFQSKDASEILLLFSGKGSGSDSSVVRIWEANFFGRTFYVVIRVSSTSDLEYSLVSAQKINKKLYSNLSFSMAKEYKTPGGLQVVLDEFYDRMAQCIFTRDDLKYLKK